MKRKIKIYGVIYFIGVLVAIGVYFYFNSINKNSDTVEIIQDGQIINTIDLAKVSSPYQLEIKYGEHVNVIQVEQNKISIVKSDCPDKICLEMGVLSKNSPPIVCLPHRLTIQYADKDVDS